MKSISIDLDYIRYFDMVEDEIIDDLYTLQSVGVSTLVIPYEIFLNKELDGFKNKILKCLSRVKFNIIFRAQSIRNYYTNYTNDKELDESITVHRQFIYQLAEDLTNKNVANKFSVIFTGSKVVGNDIGIFYEKMVYFFNELCEGVSKLDVDILLETTEIDYRMGRLIGNLWKDIRYIIERVGKDNFGISWNMKASRVNSREYDDALIPDKDILDRIKFAILTNQNTFTNGVKQFNVEMQYEEVKALINNMSDCIFNLEFIYSYIHENNISYLNVADSVEYLTYILTYFTNEKAKHELDINIDPEKMNRKSIRRTFEENTIAIVNDSTYKFDKIEISENDIKLNSEALFDYSKDVPYKIIIKSNDYLLELDTNLLMIRNNQKTFDYIFMINNTDRITRRKLCELIYLS